MTAPTLQALLDKAETMARDMMADHGEILPCVICHKADGESYIIPYNPAPTTMQRRFVALAIGKILREANAAAYVVLHEVWIGDHPSRQAAEAALVKGPPSKSPERIDGALVEAHNIASTEVRMFKIDRSGKKPSLVPFHDPADDPGNAVKNSSSIWDGLLWMSRTQQDTEPPGVPQHDHQPTPKRRRNLRRDGVSARLCGESRGPSGCPYLVRSESRES